MANQKEKTAAITKEEKKGEKLTIHIDEKLDFTANVRSKIMTSFELCETVISPFFKFVFSDFEGCSVKMNMGRLVATIFFNTSKNYDDSKYKATQTIGSSNTNTGNSMLNKIQMMNKSMKSSNMYELTKEAKELLSDYVVKQFKAGDNINWANYVSEVSEPVSYNTAANNVYIQVSNIDIMAILKEVYGNKDNENNSYVDYNVTIVKDVVGGVAGTPNMLLNIARLNVEETKRIASRVGINPTVSNIFMVR